MNEQGKLGPEQGGLFGLFGDLGGDRADRGVRALGDPLRLLSTWKSAKKKGDWKRIGRHEANGLVPVRLYRSIVSWVIAWRDSGSVLPLYLAWIFCISGWMRRIRREAWICSRRTGARGEDARPRSGR